MKVAFFLCLIISVFSNVFSSYNTVTLRNNKYRGIVIAIDSKVPESDDLIRNIKDVFIKSSIALYTATRQRAYFRQITILVPKQWKGKYTAADVETFEQGDFIVANPNPAFGAVPYTVTYEGCGKPGSYVHITPSFLTGEDMEQRFGPRDKVIVHEWAHLRWGVFDETPQNGYPPFFLFQDRVTANRCPLSLGGYLFTVEDGKAKSCILNKETNLPEPHCTFFPKTPLRDGLKTSLMSHHYLDQVTTFCHSDSDDPINRHNPFAPNEQNRLCERQSVWDVILQSPDFRNNNPPNEDVEVDLIPTFKVVQVVPQRIVLVLDISSSMGGQNKLENMRRAVSTFLLDCVPRGSYVGMVEFDKNPRILSELLPIRRTNNNAEYLVTIIPDKTGSGTGIGGGIEEGLKVLGSGNGGSLIVLTDGQENSKPYVEDVRNQVIEAGATVNTIFFATDENQDLKTLSDDTGGRWFFADSGDTSGLFDDFCTAAQQSTDDRYEKNYQMLSDSAILTQELEYDNTVLIDRTVGNFTVFTFSWISGNAPLVRILTPKTKCYYTNENNPSFNLCFGGTSVHKLDDSFNNLRFEIPGKAENGIWSFNVKLSSGKTQDLTITVSSAASNLDEEPIVLTGGLTKTTVDGETPAVIFAKVTKGYTPVLGVKVTAKVTRPDGTVTNVNLKDNGAGADVRKNDGVYTKYYTRYTASGRYPIQFKVKFIKGEDNGQPVASKAFVNFGTTDENGNLNLNPVVKKYNVEDIGRIMDQNEIEDFERILSGGAFELSGGNINPSSIPPAKITDLELLQKDLQDYTSGVQVTFTAPGANADDWTATRYEIKYSYTNGTAITEWAIVNPQNVATPGDINQPQVSGEQEIFVFTLQDIPLNVDRTELSVHVLAYDNLEISSDMSNIETITLYMNPDSLPTLDDVDNGGSDTYIILLAVFIPLIVFVGVGAIVYVKKHKNSLPKKFGNA